MWPFHQNKRTLKVGDRVWIQPELTMTLVPATILATSGYKGMVIAAVDAACSGSEFQKKLVWRESKDANLACIRGVLSEEQRRVYPIPQVVATFLAIRPIPELVLVPVRIIIEKLGSQEAAEVFTRISELY